MTPGTSNERIVVGVPWVHLSEWLSGGALVDVADATFSVFDALTGNLVLAWSVASGHITIASKRMTIAVPMDEVVQLAARKLQLRYRYDMTAVGGIPEAKAEGRLVLQ